MNIYFDIETVPSQDEAIKAEIRDGITAPAQYKKPDSIAAWMAENRDAEAEAAWLKTSFDGGAGQVCVIGWAIEDGEAMSMQVTDLSRDAEREMLSDWFDWLTKFYSGYSGMKPVLIGHNSIAFDLPFLWKRAMVLGVRPPFWFPRNPKPWSDVVADTMLLWDANQRAGGSMARLCRLFGLEGKGDIDGSKVWPMVRDGQIDAVAEYCRADVDRTRTLYQRMLFQVAE